MPASALALVIFAGLIHSIWNIAAKKAGGDSRFATFTGYPTVVGWGHHEWGWRNDTHPALDRMTEVKEAYASGSAAIIFARRTSCGDSVRPVRFVLHIHLFVG